MRVLKWVGLGFLGLVVGFVVLERIAAERVEVVELITTDEAGEAVTTRLWIVDHEGYQYLRVGGDGSGWFSRLEANETVELIRGDTTATYTTARREDLSEAINELMQAKYTWGDSFIGAVVGSREGSIPIELRPVTEVVGQR